MQINCQGSGGFGLRTKLKSMIILTIAFVFLNIFAADSRAVAAEVNANFDAAKTAVDDNNSRITQNEADITMLSDILTSIGTPRTISIPARALSFDPGGTVITDPNGLLWQQNFSGGAKSMIKAPADYAGGDVDFHIFFRTTTTASGVVDFFIRPNSFNHGDDVESIASESSAGVSVAGSALGTYYQQTITIPSARLTGDWWHNSIQRQGSESTYTGDVVVYSIAFEYAAIQ